LTPVGVAIAARGEHHWKACMAVTLRLEQLDTDALGFPVHLRGEGSSGNFQKPADCGGDLPPHPLTPETSPQIRFCDPARPRGSGEALRGLRTGRVAARGTMWRRGGRGSEPFHCPETLTRQTRSKAAKGRSSQGQHWSICGIRHHADKGIIGARED
jgi:hypothetical protein